MNEPRILEVPWVSYTLASLACLAPFVAFLLLWPNP